MILVLYDTSDSSTKDFVDYLRAENINFVAIDTEHLIKAFAISDDGNSCKWTNICTKNIVDFDEVSGVYFRIQDVEIKYLDHYKIEDRHYLTREWRSYLTYRIQNTKNVINGITPEVASSTIFQFPFYLSKAQVIGMNVPQYTISSDFKEIQSHYADGKNYISRTSLYNSANLQIAKELPKETIGLIERPLGELVVVHVLDDEIFACKYQGSSSVTFNIDKKVSTLCLKLSQSLQLRAMQCMFILCTIRKDYVLMHLSPYPNWLHNSTEQKQKIYEFLTHKLQTSVA